LNPKILELKAAQAQMLEDRKRLKKDLRNAEHKRKRIKERARQLTDENLLAVLMICKEQRRDPTARDSMSAASTTPRVPGLPLRRTPPPPPVACTATPS